MMTLVWYPDAGEAMTVERPSEPARLTAIIVSHGQSVNVATQLTRYFEHPDSARHVDWVVVHNHPADPSFGDADAAKPSGPWLSARHLRQTNRGYGAAVNLGAREGQGGPILALNADLVPEPGFLEHVLSKVVRLAEAEPDIGIVSFRLLNTDGTPQGSVGRFPNLARVLVGLLRPRSTRKYESNGAEGLRTVDWGTGACLWIRRECWDELGGFDEQYFLYYEDVDLCRRARSAGWRVVYDPGAACRHFFPYHSRRLTGSMVVVARRAILLYFWRHRPRWEYRLLGGIIRLECWLRPRNAAWRSVRRVVRAFLADPDHHRLSQADLDEADVLNR